MSSATLPALASCAGVTRGPMPPGARAKPLGLASTPEPLCACATRRKFGRTLGGFFVWYGNGSFLKLLCRASSSMRLSTSGAITGTEPTFLPGELWGHVLLHVVLDLGQYECLATQRGVACTCSCFAFAMKRLRKKAFLVALPLCVPPEDRELACLIFDSPFGSWGQICRAYPDDKSRERVTGALFTEVTISSSAISKRRRCSGATPSSATGRGSSRSKWPPLGTSCAACCCVCVQARPRRRPRR